MEITTCLPQIKKALEKVKNKFFDELMKEIHDNGKAQHIGYGRAMELISEVEKEYLSDLAKEINGTK